MVIMNKVTTVDLFSPELSQYWLNSIDGNVGRVDRRQQLEVKREEQDAALSELSERIQAARTIV
jgi:hypothetical protein